MERLKQMQPLAEAWHTNQAEAVDRLAQRVFDALVEGARDPYQPVLYQKALELLTHLRPEAYRKIPADSFLEAINEVAEEQEQLAATLAAVGLLEYGLWVVKENGGQADPHNLYKTHEHASRLYDHLGWLGRAYYHLMQARIYARGQQKQQLSDRLHKLGERKQAADAGSEQERTQALTGLVDQLVFNNWVDLVRWQQMIGG